MLLTIYVQCVGEMLWLTGCKICSCGGYIPSVMEMRICYLIIICIFADNGHLRYLKGVVATVLYRISIRCKDFNCDCNHDCQFCDKLI